MSTIHSSNYLLLKMSPFRRFDKLKFSYGLDSYPEFIFLAQFGNVVLRRGFKVNLMLLNLFVQCAPIDLLKKSLAPHGSLGKVHLSAGKFNLT